MEQKKTHYREYKDYPDYVEQQKSKLITLWKFLPTYDQKYSEILFERLKESEVVKQGMNALCLAARIGTEVKSFHKLGCFAVGIDLITSENNKYVLYGDFHKLQFPTNSADDVLALIKGFTLIKRTRFTYPWKGEHCVFKKDD